MYLFLLQYSIFIITRYIACKRYIQVIIITLGVVAIWYFVQAVLVGIDNFPGHLGAIQASSRVTVFLFSLARIPRNVWYSIYSGAPIFILPGLGYCSWLCRKQNISSLRQLPLILVVILWLTWFIIASIGWHRYAMDAYIFAALLSSKLLVDSIRFLVDNHQNNTQKKKFLQWISVGFIVIMLIGSLWGLTNQVKSITMQSVDSIIPFSNYLKENINPDVVIESWEWQIDPLADLTYHHPTNDWVDKGTLLLTFGKEFDKVYNFSMYDPEYLIDGPNSKSVNLYTAELSTGNFSLIFSAPPYDLYKVNKP